MAREIRIPSTSTFIEDYGLNVSPEPTVKNRRVVVFGTSEDGPMYEPISINKPEDAEIIFGGGSGAGDLIRGVFETWNAQIGNPDVVAVRIGNGKKAILNIREKLGSGLNEEANVTDGLTSIKIEAKYPGALYNQVSIRYDDYRRVAIYNPKTKITTVLTVDTANPYNSSVDVHNVRELADAINSDSNLSSIVVATTEELKADYEIKNQLSGDPIVNSDGLLNLQTLFTNTPSSFILSGTNAYMVGTPAVAYASLDSTSNGEYKNLTMANNITTLDGVEVVGISSVTNLELAGSTAKFPIMPLDGKGRGEWNTIQCIDDNAGDYKTVKTGTTTNTVTSEYFYAVDNVLIDDIPLDANGVNATNTFVFSSPLPLDDRRTVSDTTNVVAKNWITANTEYNIYQTKTAAMLSANDFEAYSVKASLSIDPAGDWLDLPIGSKGVYISGYTNGKVTFSIGVDVVATPLNGSATYSSTPIATGANLTTVLGLTPAVDTCWKITVAGSYTIPSAKSETNADAIYAANVGDFVVFTVGNGKFKFVSGTDSSVTYNTNIGILVDNSGKIKEGVYVRVSGKTVKGILTEVNTLAQLEAIGGTVLKSYFVRGNEVVFNTVPAFPIYVRYGTRVNYEVGGDVVLEDGAKGVIKFVDPLTVPVEGASIRLRYRYLPNFPAITSGAQALKGGTSGVKLTVKDREEQLRTAYKYLSDYPANIFVPMGAYIDAIKEDYNKQTGAKERMANSYASDIQDFLEDLSINSIQPHAVLGTTQIAGNSIVDRDTWVKNLSEIDVNDATRGANSMARIQTKFITVAAFEYVVPNVGRGVPYFANGQTAYAGALASNPYDISPVNKPIPGVVAIRKELSVRQQEAMNDMRYVTMKTKRDGRPVVVNDNTAAPYGSDFTSWTNFSITAEAADRVKAIAEEYIGKPNSVEVRHSLESAISDTLRTMSGVRTFDFQITSTLEQQVLGILEIDIVIVPIFTLKRIRTSVKLRKNIAA